MTEADAFILAGPSTATDILVAIKKQHMIDVLKAYSVADATIAAILK